MRAVDAFIAECQGWPDFWARLANVQNQQVPSGKAFERLTQLYLQTHPEYRTQLKHVWRLEEVPLGIRRRLNLPATDEGIDIVAETLRGQFWTIQCKFRSDSAKALTYGELSTFTSLSFVTCREIALAVVAHTCAKPVKKSDLLGNATAIGLDRWLDLKDEDWAAIHATLEERTQPLFARQPRPHQLAAINSAKAHFATADRGRLIMPCGTGKSLTAFWIAQALDAKTTVVAVPSLALIRQSLVDWTREYLANGEVPSWLVVCSDESTGKLAQDEFVGDTYDLGIPTTTSTDEIRAFLNEPSGRRILFTTYQSSDRLAEAVSQAGITIDLAILDEAHKTVGAKSKSFAALLSDDNVKVRQRLFMTATERVIQGANEDVFSMDDVSVYGKRFHLLTFKDAIALGVISDYKILTITITDRELRDIVLENRLVDVDGVGSDISAQSLAAAVALRQAFEQYSVTHAISFHRSIRTASEFAEQQSQFGVGTLGITSMHISSKRSAGERAALLRSFAEESRALMTNARCLTEGVDVPSIDCVLFADPKQSVVDIVQAAGRALRPYLDKRFGYILLPLVVPDGMEIDDFAATSEFATVLRAITALSLHDERIAEQFRVSTNPSGSYNDIVQLVGRETAISIDVKLFASYIRTKIWERIGPKHWRPFAQAREYARSLHMGTILDWQRLFRAGKLPPDIPARPDCVYSGLGFLSFQDWLGTKPGVKRVTRYAPPKSHLPFSEALRFVRALNLTSVAQWRIYARSSERPAGIPSSPQNVYRSEWISYCHWLGIPEKIVSVLPFHEARDFVRKLGLRTATDWYSYARSEKRPRWIPTHPEQKYVDQGWCGMRDWLGTAPRYSFRPFEDARAFARGLHFKRGAEWRAYCKSGNLPSDVPKCPWTVYPDEYKNIADWLGSGRGLA